MAESGTLDARFAQQDAAGATFEMARKSSSARAPVAASAAASTAAAAPLRRIAVRSVNRIVIVPVTAIVRLEAEDNYVRIWADRPYLHKETLSGLIARLERSEFLRVHRSHGVKLRAVRELRPLLHGEYLIVLSDGTEITSGRSYRDDIQQTFDLVAAPSRRG
jgi:two-component system, LytTR family, response regulator